MLLENKVAIVTGAASERGIGFATARLFAEHGARVALADLAAADPAAYAARIGEAQVGEAHRGYAIDVRDGEACRALVDAVAADFGGVDILVGNAGVVHGTPIEDIDRAEYDEIMDTNLGGNFQMAQAVVPVMRKAGGGAIICVSSIAGRRGGGLFGSAHYSATKAGIFGLVRALARELAGDGIRVNAVAPGTLDNDFTRGAMTDAHKAEIAKGVPMGRLGESHEIAGPCLFLASALSSYVTGVVLDVNGGLQIQ